MKIVYDLMDTCCTGLTKLIIGQERKSIKSSYSLEKHQYVNFCLLDMNN